ncbi:acyltransferase [Salinicola endophyticus]|uniref:Acyltransferase n=1 Tax=Salinicola endophyticus TaxID=1949083 RepID=A0ABY8FDP3_9GAMM|nr:acyltransferase [Salinicola endophyticus]WFF40921.1 acyltransferase [Salinicola endophyticus]
MLVSVQALRALAAWIVVFHHFMQVFFGFQADNWVEYLLSTRGQVGVDIFFVISGFVITVSTRGKRLSMPQFLLQRCARIVPAYWLYTAITALVIVFTSDVMPEYGFSVIGLIKSLLFIPAENPAGYGYYPILPVGWTLNFEMLFYLVFAASLLLARPWRLWGLVIAIVAINTLFARQPFISSFYSDPIIFEFLLGVGIGVYYARHGLPTGRVWPLLLIGLSVATLLSFDDPAGTLRFFAWGLPSALLVIACIALEPHIGDNRVFKRMGDWSYSTYLLHVIVLWCGNYLLTQRLGLGPYLTLAICLPLIALLSWISFELVEKRLSRRIKRWLPPPRATTASA